MQMKDGKFKTEERTFSYSEQLGCGTHCHKLFPRPRTMARCKEGLDNCTDNKTSSYEVKLRV